MNLPDTFTLAVPLPIPDWLTSFLRKCMALGYSLVAVAPGVVEVTRGKAFDLRQELELAKAPGALSPKHSQGDFAAAMAAVQQMFFERELRRREGLYWDEYWARFLGKP